MVINMEKPVVVLTAVLVVKKGTKVVVGGQTVGAAGDAPSGPSLSAQSPGAGTSASASASTAIS